MNSRRIHPELKVSIYVIAYKFLLGVLELILGFGIIIFGNQILKLYFNFREQELINDPDDLIVHLVEKVIPYFLAYRSYIILILIVLGLVKVVGAVGLYYKKYWGLDLLIGLTFLLLPFDLATLLEHSSWTKVFYFLINLLIALYLVQFQPTTYFKNLKDRISMR